jgi:hypothetical protein
MRAKITPRTCSVRRRWAPTRARRHGVRPSIRPADLAARRRWAIASIRPRALRDTPGRTAPRCGIASDRRGREGVSGTARDKGTHSFRCNTRTSARVFPLPEMVDRRAPRFGVRHPKAPPDRETSARNRDSIGEHTRFRAGAATVCDDFVKSPIVALRSFPFVRRGTRHPAGWGRVRTSACAECSRGHRVRAP